MKHLIDKDDLIAEIKYHLQFTPEHTNAFIEGEEHAYRTILSFLDTLEVKEVDLDCIKKELDEFIRIHKSNGDFGWGTLYNVATHFFELGLKAQKGE